MKPQTGENFAVLAAVFIRFERLVDTLPQYKPINSPFISLEDKIHLAVAGLNTAFIVQVIEKCEQGTIFSRFRHGSFGILRWKLRAA
jgi:hypothetical protein